MAAARSGAHPDRRRHDHRTGEAGRRAGAEITYQVTTESDGSSALVFVGDVPAMGYAALLPVDGAPAVSAAEVSSPIPTGMTMNLGPDFRFNLDGNGFLRGLISNSSGETLMALPNEPPGTEDLGGLLWWGDENYGNSYDYGPALRRVRRWVRRRRRPLMSARS